MCLAHSGCRVCVRFPIDRSVNAFFDDRQGVCPPGDKTSLVVAPDCDLGHEIGPQFGNLWQREAANCHCGHLFGIGSKLVDVDDQLIEQFTSTRNARVQLFRKLAGQKLFHQLVKDDTAASSGADHVEMFNMVLRNHDAIERVAAPIGIMLAGPAPDDQRRALLDGSLLSCKNVGRLFVWPRRRFRPSLKRKGRQIQVGNVVLMQVYRAEPGVFGRLGDVREDQEIPNMNGKSATR